MVAISLGTTTILMVHHDSSLIKKFYVYSTYISCVKWLLISEQEGLSIKEILNEIPGAVKKLAMNYTFLLISLEESCETVLLAGLGAFLPKIIESQFAVSSSTSALIVGKRLKNVHWIEIYDSNSFSICFKTWRTRSRQCRDQVKLNQMIERSWHFE